MAGQTNSDRIRELERETAALVARADSLQRDIDRIEKAHEAASKLLVQVESRIAVLDNQTAELKRTGEEGDRKRWTLVVAVVGSILALIANILLTVIRK